MITRRLALSTTAALFANACVGSPTQAALRRRGGTANSSLSGGRVLAYCEFGEPSGPLVFYFHGTPGSRLEAVLLDQEARQAGIRLVAVDRPGIGNSTHAPCRKILDWPQDMVNLADTLGCGDSAFGVMGLSGGAPYATACAYTIPERLTHVAVVSGHTPPNAPGVSPGSEDRSISFLNNHPRLARRGVNFVARRLDRKPDKIVRRVSKNWSAADKQLVLGNPQYYQQLVSTLDAATRCGSEGVLTDVRLLGSSWGFSLNAIHGVGVSIWQGGCDRIANTSMAEYFHRQIAGSELTIDPRAGHLSMIKWHAPEIFARFQV